MSEVAHDQHLDNYWMPFTSNRYFHQHPRLIASAQGAYVTTTDGKKLFDCLSGLWCVIAGHAHTKIVETVARQAATLDYCSAFQWGHPQVFKLAERLASWAPGDLNRVFFCNSGSEAVDTSLKIAIAYHRLRGEASRTRIIGRERGYHGVGLGGISVGGMVANRKMFAPLMINGVDHLPHTHNPAQMAFTRGQPEWGTHLADELERLVALHDASTIAAVIVEPMQGSTGVLVPPKGYLQRLREICTKHGILLIFDEVITGFGRLGTRFGAERVGVTPDLMTFAKGVTNGVIPMGGVIARQGIFDTFMQGQQAANPWAIELFHGYTYSGHPMAAAVGNTMLDIIEGEGLLQRSAALEPVLEAAVHSLKGEPGVLDIRNFGLAAGVDLEPWAGKPGLRALKTFERGLELGQAFRFGADTLTMAPPYISTEAEIAKMVDDLRTAIRTAQP